jgi:dTDP-4-dehydrorhamnose 3,5-epimerase
MKVTNTKILDVKVIEPSVYGDQRGYFMETWNSKSFKEQVSDKDFVQDNQSKSKKGILRGLHFQSKDSQGKLVRVISGEVFDVAVDLRVESETYGEWVGVYLTEDNKKQLWIPEGFAHGFYVVSESAEFVYKCTRFYNPEFEHTLSWDDSDVNINWPISDEGVILSDKDKEGLTLKECHKLLSK